MTALDPVMQSLLDRMEVPDFEALSTEEALAYRRRPRLYPALAAPRSAEVRDRVLAQGPRLRCYFPAGEGPFAVVLNIHGGGFVQGQLEMDDRLCDDLVGDLGCVVVSTDYRLAPEHPFPVGLEDILTVCDWLAGPECDLPIRIADLVLCGTSAGAALAASTAQALRDRGAGQARGLILLSPVCDHRSDRPSYVEHGRSKVLSAINMRRSWQAYVPSGREEDLAAASPLRAGLSDLPPVLMIIAGQDPLRDEALEMAKMLRDCGGRVETALHEDAPHAFTTIAPHAPTSQRAMARITGFLKALWADKEKIDVGVA